MLRGWLTIDQSVGLNGALLRIALPFEYEAVILRPFGCVLRRVGPQYVWEPGLERLVAFELTLDLPQEAFCDRAGMRKNPNREIGIAEQVLDRETERNNGRFVVLACPEIEVSIRPLLNLPASIEQPLLLDISPFAPEPEQEVQIVQAP